MTGHVRIDVSELRLACNKVLDVVAERLGPEVVLGDESFVGDHYWELTLEASFGLVDHPELHIVAGQTSDDVDELRGISDSEDVVLWHDIGHISGVLRRIASLNLREARGDGTDPDWMRPSQFLLLAVVGSSSQRSGARSRCSSRTTLPTALLPER